MHLQLLTTNKLLSSENEMLPWISSASLQISLIRNINTNKAIQSWQFNDKRHYSHNITSCCLHNTSILDHKHSSLQTNVKMNYLPQIYMQLCIAKSFWYHFCNLWQKLVDPSFMNCAGHIYTHIFNVSTLKGVAASHDCCSERGKSSHAHSRAKHLSAPLLLPAWKDVLITLAEETLRIPVKFLQLLSNEDTVNIFGHVTR